VGLLNGVIVVKLGIPSLVATIGTQFFWRGFLNVALKGQGHSLVMTQGTLFRDVLVKKFFTYIPMQMFWMVLIALAVWFVLNRHRLGAHIYLVGDNENSARLMGINVGQTRMYAFALVGLAAALGGLIQSVDVRYFWPNVGQGYLMVALAAVFLGGTSPFGGTGSILGTFVGAMIIAWINPAIVAIGWTDVGWTELIYGLIITAAVAMHVLLRKRVS
jgi:simple sugar transport system permease protein